MTGNDFYNFLKQTNYLKKPFKIKIIYHDHTSKTGYPVHILDRRGHALVRWKNELSDITFTFIPAELIMSVVVESP